MSAADPLLQPFRLKHLTFKNRVMSTAHAPTYVEDGLPRQRYQLYHEEKAKGGLALTMFGGSSSVAADSPSSFGQIDIGHDRIIPVLQEFAERIHAHGCALDGPDHPCRAAHPLGRRRLAAHRLGLALARAAAPLLPQGAGGRGHPPHPPGLSRRRRCGRRRAGSTGVEVLCSLAPARPVLVAGDEPPHRRLWRQPRQPHPLHAGDVRGDPRGGRAGLRRRHPHVRRRDAGGRPGARGEPGDRRPPRRERPDRLSQRHRRRRQHRSRHLQADPDHGPAHGALSSSTPAPSSRRPACRCSTPPASPTPARRGTPSPRAMPTWSA